MARPIWLYLTVVALVSVVAASRSFANDAPIRAVTLIAHHEGKSYPIIKVKKQKPEIDVGGALVALDPKSDFAFRWDSDFAPGTIHVKEQEATTNSLTGKYSYASIGGSVDMGVDYFAEVVSTESLKDCYLALITYDPQSLTGIGQPAHACFFKAIGDLKAGHATTVHLDVDPDVFPHAVAVSARFFPLFFSAGRQIRLDGDTLSFRYFDGYRHILHHLAVEKRVSENFRNDLPVSVFLLMPVVPDATSHEVLPPAADVALEIGPRGFVDKLEISTPLPPEFEKKFKTLLKSWLFLPAVHSGMAVRADVHMRIPLNTKS